MQVFKAALKIFSKHPIYVAIYIVWLSFMALFIGISNVEDRPAEFDESRPNIAIIDRDESAFSEGLTAFLADQAVLIEVEDSRAALQEATAQNLAAYIMIIPENYGEDFMAATQQGQSMDPLETVVSYESIAANMMNGLVDSYLNTAKTHVLGKTAASQNEVIRATNKDMEHTAEVTMLNFSDSAPVSGQWTLYMKFSGYTIMLSIIVCAGVVFSSFNRTEIRRRAIVSSTSSLSMNLQLAAAAFIIMLLAWAWVSMLGLVVFGGSLSAVDPLIVGLIILALLAFCTFPLAVGFFIGQLTTSEIALNSIGNVLALALSFLGGLWLSLDLMSDGVVAVAHFTPTFYYSETISGAVALIDHSSASLMPLVSNIGIMFLFSISVFALALVAGRLRMQSAEAGGNAGAERSKS